MFYLQPIKDQHSKQVKMHFQLIQEEKSLEIAKYSRERRVN